MGLKPRGRSKGRPWLDRYLKGWAERWEQKIDPRHRVERGRETSDNDWCRFRRDSHCWYSGQLDLPNTEKEGFAVWKVEDRGYCWRTKHSEQKECPLGEPGPNSGEPTFYNDATIPYDRGGQRAH